MARSIRCISLKRLFLVVGSLTCAISLAVIGTRAATNALDTYTLSHADPAMRALAIKAGMNRTGELIFLRTQPQLVSDAQMEHLCAQNTAANNSNGFIEQGCYVTSTHRIYLRRMPASLYDLEVSTAAYEMLHPIYISLVRSNNMRTTLNHAIEANYTNVQDNDLQAQVANFAKTEPDARDLELFSLLGTGYARLSPDLTRYYAPYFSNLQASVAASTRVKQRFAQSADQLDQTKTQIDQYNGLARAAYASSVTRAHADDQLGDTYYYNLYRQYIDQENAAITQYNTLLASYNALVTEYNGTQPVQQINAAQTQSN